MAGAGKLLSTRKRTVIVLLSAGGLFLLGFIVLGLVGIEVWEYTNSVTFCTSTCHDVHPEEPVAHQDSYHALVKCTECHMGRVSTLEAIALKTTHARHLPAVLLGNYGRPLESESMRPAEESCERCHWPPAFHDDAAREVRTFLPDRYNTELRTYLLLRTGAGTPGTGQGYGIHWHISNVVEYVATDEHGQEIPWVRVTRADGTTVEYGDVSNPLSPEEVARAEKHVMDCIDCHNRVGHPFPPPEELIDQALADGRLSRDLPYAKQEMLRLLSGDYATQAEALAAVGSLPQRYRDLHPQVAAEQAAEIEAAVALGRDLVTRVLFETPDVSWQSFPDNNGHEEAGCFRCHDGKHTNPQGEAIRLQCTLCHSIPATLAPGDDLPDMPIAWLQAPPESHAGANFVRDHRFLARDECADCHGEIEFGNDGTSFCSNSACHGRAWPAVDLDATLAHSLPLDGAHAEAECYRCHEGVSQIEYKCANCHEPPDRPHFGDNCQACHGAVTFAGADAGSFVHRPPLEGRHAAADCAECHTVAEVPDDDCTTCHEPPPAHLVGSCDLCHTPVAWTGPGLYAVVLGAPIPHGLYRDCAACHEPGGQNWPAPADHAALADEQCTLCHSGGGAALSLFDHDELDLFRGRHDDLACIECHADGQFDGTPQTCVACHDQEDAHDGELGQDCAECHSPAGWTEAAFDHKLAGFRLTGQHVGVDCASCHAEGTYAGTSRGCASCHDGDDAHEGQLGQDCAQCHTAAGWEGAAIDHNTTAFALTGQHADASCAGCHSGGTYAGTPTACASCHGDDDAHRGQFGKNCAQCHSPAGWPGATFDHGTTGFVLIGQHVGTACASCHANGTYAGTPTACASCHGDDDAHNGQFGQDCAQCHTPAGWSGASFDPNTTAFPLTGAHTGAACTLCHGDGAYAGTPTACAACHGEPAFHAGILGTDCAACHNTAGWLPASYNQPHTFPFGHGRPGSCQTCHPETLAGYTCYACHDPDGIAEEHHEEDVPDYSNCVMCHPTGDD
ncbi:MAG: hypothetical protein P8129_05065 [Anaerolineae bacterium]